MGRKRKERQGWSAGEREHSSGMAGVRKERGGHQGTQIPETVPHDVRVVTSQ